MAQKDVFISYAGEDRAAVAEPLARALRDENYAVWFDQWELKLGDPLSDRISEGLSQSRFGVVIVSPAFAAKQWPRDELAVLTTRRAVIPVLYGMSARDVANSPVALLAGLKYTSYDGHDLARLVREVTERIGRPATKATVAVDLSRSDWSDLAEAFHDRDRYATIRLGLLREEESWRNAEVLIAPPPWRRNWEQPEIEDLVGWVSAGHGLLVLGHYAPAHHESNMGALAWPFDVEFGDDLLMPAGSDAANRDIYNHSPDIGVSIPVPDGPDIARSVGDVTLVHSCSVLSSSKAEPVFRLTAPPGTQSWRPVGRLTGPGHRRNIEKYVLHRVAPSSTGDRQSPPLEPIDVAIARHHGDGKVAVVGTWKLFTVATPGNRRLVDNLLAWLAGRD